MKPTEVLADFLFRTTLEDIPPEACQKSKRAILDVIAAAFAGIPHPVGKTMLALVKEMGGNPAATILGDGHRTSPPWAAYANGTLAHAIDYDDVNASIGGHPTAPVVPALLAMGEKVGASGKDLLLGYILGVETECKLGRAINRVHYNLGWHPTATLGTFGAAAACGKLLRLDKDQVIMSLGIAGSQASALKQNFGTMTKPLHVGQAAKNGVLAALLASRGWTADREILEGHFGFCNLFAAPGKYDLKDMTENLGRPFDVVEPGIELKKYPCCGSTHPTLDALLRLKGEQPFRAEEVESVELKIHPERIHVLVHPDPQTGLEGKFSVEYCIAAAVLRGRVSIEDFSEDRIKAPEIRAFLPRVRVIRDPDRDSYSITLRIGLRGGRVLTAEGKRSEGITSWEELRAKYQDCLGTVLPKEKVGRSFQIIQELENLKDISELVANLVAERS